MTPESTQVMLSVALVTRDRPDVLARALDSLRAQDVQPWEVVVSDDSASGDAVRALVDRHGYRYVEGPRRGLYANRNAAAAACRGSHIRTMDDDHELPPDHVRACLEAIATDPDVVWVIGEWDPAWGPVVVPVPPPGQLHPRGFIVQPGEGQPSAAIADGSTIYPRRVFDEGLRYEERFEFGMVYLEFGERLVHHGYCIRHLDSTYVLHHAGPSLIQTRLTTDAARAFAMLCHSFLYRPSLRDRTLTVLELARMVVFGGRGALRALARAIVVFHARRAETARR